MFQKLEDGEKRYEELNKKISDPEIIAKQAEWQKLMKEHAMIEDVALKYKEYKNRVHSIVESTNGMYVTYEGKVADTLFFSTSSGYTENSGEIFSTQQPYLVSVESNWDAEVSPVFNDYFYFTLSDFYNRLGLSYNSNFQNCVLYTYMVV